MTNTEFRIKTIEEYLENALSTQEASRRLGLHRVSFWRLVKRYEQKGRRGVEHGLKGRRSNRSKPEVMKRAVRTLYGTDYAASGRSVLSFYRELRGVFFKNVSYGTIRAWIQNKPILEIPPNEIPHRTTFQKSVR